MGSIIWTRVISVISVLTVFTMNGLIASVEINKFNPNPKHYTSYHFEWNSPSQWLTNTQSNDIISCTIRIPYLCIYTVPNQPSFQLFYNELMFDFLNDDQWTKINIIDSKKNSNNKQNRRRLRKRKRKRRRQRLAFSGPFSYGCFNALCTTVLGPPQIIGPPMPTRPRRRRRRRRYNFKRCDRCGNKKYPGYIYTGGPAIMGPMGGMTPLMYRSRMHRMGGMGMGGMGMGGMGGLGTNTLHIISHKGEADKRRLIDDDREYKIIEKCIDMDMDMDMDMDVYVHVCVTYYYFDGSISLDYNYNIVKYKLFGEKHDKYYKTSVWIWNKHEIESELSCNDALNVCVDATDNNNTFLYIRNKKESKLHLSSAAWSAMYDIEITRDDEIIHKKKLCQNVFIEKETKELCVEIFDNDRDIQEIQISVETLLDNKLNS